jgi:hypothetical protein
MQWVTNTPKKISRMEIAAHWDGDVKGEPKPSATATVEQLKGWGMVGLYRPSTAAS